MKLLMIEHLCLKATFPDMGSDGSTAEKMSGYSYCGSMSHLAFQEILQSLFTWQFHIKPQSLLVVGLKFYFLLNRLDKTTLL